MSIAEIVEGEREGRRRGLGEAASEFGRGRGVGFFGSSFAFFGRFFVFGFVGVGRSRGLGLF